MDYANAIAIITMVVRIATVAMISMCLYDITREIVEQKEEIKRLRKEAEDCTERLGQRTEEMQEHIKKIRIELAGKSERQPLPDRFFNEQYTYIVKPADERIRYTAAIALETILAELPEEKKTTEIINAIAGEIRRQAEERKIM